MKIAIASGKGGTGKTTLSAALALSAAEPVQLIDCDVEEPNCHIFMPVTLGEEIPVEVLKPVVDEDKCLKCGRCGEICQFNAIVSLKTKPLVFPELCHSCGGCRLVCPTGAISEQKVRIGVSQQGSSGTLDFIMGRLDVGEAMSIPVIKAVKAQAKAEGLVIFDAPPGTSCPFIETVTESDYVLLVTEPTPFGRHDLSLAVDTMRKLDIPFSVVVNRVTESENLITEYCRAEKLEILLQIPQSRQVAEAYSRGEDILKALPELKVVLLEMIENIKLKAIKHQQGESQ